MALQVYHLSLLFLLCWLMQNVSAADNNSTDSINRQNFTSDFIFGASTSAYQVEGGAKEGGRGKSIWDTFSHKYSGKIVNGSTGDVAVESFRHYKEDVGIVREMGLDAYKFSISWSRILPNGTVKGGVNYDGIKYYSNLINGLQAGGIKPFVSLFHWDLPQALEDDYGGFLSPKVVDDFRDYADICFREFGTRVKHWITIDDPWSYAVGGYATGKYAPGRCSKWQKMNCTDGHSGTEPYLAAHHLLLAHGSAVKHYRQQYKATQHGTIGISLQSHWFEPLSNKTEDRKAAHRARDFMLRWFLNPLTDGHYPQSMKSLVGYRLPKFFKKQSDIVRESYDFIGLSYYTANYASEPSNHTLEHDPSYVTDARVNLTTKRDGNPIGTQVAGSDWLYVYPKGLHDLLGYVKKRFNNPVVYITENGIYDVNNGTFRSKEIRVDKYRIEYHLQHLSSLQTAIKAGANVKGYFVRSLLDGFEWNYGYSAHFGFFSVDIRSEFKRHPKHSAKWFRKFLRK